MVEKWYVEKRKELVWMNGCGDIRPTWEKKEKIHICHNKKEV